MKYVNRRIYLSLGVKVLIDTIAVLCSFHENNEIIFSVMSKAYS